MIFHIRRSRGEGLLFVIPGFSSPIHLQIRRIRRQDGEVCLAIEIPDTIRIQPPTAPLDLTEHPLAMFYAEEIAQNQAELAHLHAEIDQALQATNPHPTNASTQPVLAASTPLASPETGSALRDLPAIEVPEAEAQANAELFTKAINGPEDETAKQ